MSKNTSEHLENILAHLPKTPGVYQMKDKTGKVMYVGKAKNLKNRVSSYFVRTNELSVAKKQMVGKIADIEILVCETEVEALVLETNIIKHLSPKYNILMKDDKNLAYLKITNSIVPELIKTRQKFQDGGKYFGPFVSNVEESVRALRRIFKIRNCRIKFGMQNGDVKILDKAGKTIPCMDYYIGLCPAPCLLQSVGLKNHEDNVGYAISFLSGTSHSLFMELEEEMKEKARDFKFEEAQKIKSTIETLRGLHERQIVSNMIDGDIDIFMLYEKYDKIYIGLTQLRGGKIIGVFRHEALIGAEEESDIIVSFLARQYIDDENLPTLILTSIDIQDRVFLDFLSSKKIEYEIPKIGPKHDLIDFTLNQIREYAYKKELATLETKTLSREHMVHILEKLDYPIPEKGEIIFECYDISHTDGHFTYASRVSLINGKPETSRYKKYKIKTLKDGDIDDFASHKEVMYRRVLEGIELHNFPHLIIIDGGKGQLSSALIGVNEALDAYKNSIGGEKFTVPICSIAKREEEIFLPGESESIIFDMGSPELMVLQKARDESHRFSINANKTARMKSMKKNIIEELPGFGAVTRKNLLKAAGDIDGIRNLKLEELSKICTKSQIQTLKEHGIID